MSDREPLPSAKPVQVRHGDLHRLLAPGEEVTFGRGLEVDLRLAADPPDLLVSRRAGLIRCLPDAVLVSNLSSRGMLRLDAPGTAGREIGPGEAITSEPHRTFQVTVIGSYGQSYAVEVDARSLPSPSPTPSSVPTRARPALDPTVVSSPIPLTPTQRRVLAALCAPLLDAVGPPPGPASAREIGAALGLQPNYVRNVLKEIREELTANGVPGLVGEGAPQPGEDFRLPLALWAIRYGLAVER